ncbi:MAG: AAA family ATPase [Okeania sp. SIO2G4]|uniref:AAA family ATPase n=1 Tax=unclassified Okeania TaxID=2634635 RepID=UPI0013BBDF81|nr:MULTISPECIES: AAA family ATPase [unclassified Okeania]NEP07241.1 AAA family ATPase [Okeania sp. SIO4D6]NEP74381.1 AAA family ATPase [Okeania sp. SIO2G5]NEP95424.1 AAA family ATPase [Okeania sp. SIO2F5]NEQ93150.1 AAA family ATPase [Okeania sp. SIO2G4]
MIQTITKTNQNFKQLQPGIGIGVPLPQDWVSIKNEALVIIVGLTGVGKSTVINTLIESGLDFTLLPNRRTLTTELIIPHITATNEQNVQTICRIDRFKYTRQYQKSFPGGMGHILAQLQVNPSLINHPLIFDGLRGENEVTYAANTLKKAKFIILDAPLSVRLKRLLTRSDAFDKITKYPDNEVVNPQKIMGFSDFGIPEASNLFTCDEEQEILTLLERGVYNSVDVCERLNILVEESRNYNSEATKTALQTIAPERTLLLDTTKFSPQQLTQKILAYLLLKNSRV